ncbi:hypothetical protein ABIB40_001752 [Pedobacter sp. UYP30]|uniref:hypothetical protein n=1 Tax=Pedobacter sp. UYP30 TaxID=1756400 RepID=UPI003391AFFA
MKIFLSAITSTFCFFIGLMAIAWATSMVFQLLPNWAAIVLFIVFTLSSIVGVTKLCLFNIPFLWFKTRVWLPSLVSGASVILFSIFNLWNYNELNTFYFPNWAFIVLYSAIAISTISSLLNTPKAILLMRKVDYETIRNKILRNENP